MNIRQEIWTPETQWKTALNHGNLYNPSVIFCFGNPGTQNEQAIYNEVRHSFPGAELVFGFIENTGEEKLFLTAFDNDTSSFEIDQINLNDLKEDTTKIYNRFCEQKWKEVMISLDADDGFSQKMVNQLEQSFEGSFKHINTQKPNQRIRLGLNEVPTYNTSICLALKKSPIHFSIKNRSTASKGAAATQSIWDRFAGSISDQKETYTFYFPVALLGC